MFNLKYRRPDIFARKLSLARAYCTSIGEEGK